MKVFTNFPEDRVCPICKTNEDKECWLIPLDGTQEGNIEQARPIHVECTGEKLAGRMRMNEEIGIIYISDLE